MYFTHQPIFTAEYIFKIECDNTVFVIVPINS